MYSCDSKCPLPLRAFVAAAAVEAADGGDAGEGELQRQVSAEGHHLLLVHLPEGAEELYAALGSTVKGRFEVGQELFPGILERTGAKRSEGELFDAVKLAPDGWLHQEERVTARQVDRFVRRVM